MPDKDLAHLIWLYQMKEPYTEDNGPMEPTIESLNRFNKDLKRKHDGDCIGQISMCHRCHAEWTMEKAKWIGKRLSMEENHA